MILDDVRELNSEELEMIAGGPGGALAVAVISGYAAACAAVFAAGYQLGKDLAD